MMTSVPKNKNEVLQALNDVVCDPLSSKSGRTFAIALAYLVGDSVPDDRTTVRVFRKRNP